MHGAESLTPQPGATGEPPAARLLVLGGTGRLGSLLRRAWALAPDGGGSAAPGGSGDVAPGGSGIAAPGGSGIAAGVACCWQRRRATSGAPGDPLFDPLFDPLADPLADPRAFATAARGMDAVLTLAGVVAGGAGDLALNRVLALASLDAARAAGVGQVFLVSSAAVYGAVAGAAAETTPPQPQSDYGRAKLAMERAAADWVARAGSGAPRVTCLRIGNVAGADQLLGVSAAQAPRPLDILADGRGPARSYVGPCALAGQIAALAVLARDGTALPGLVNLALDGTVRMDDLLRAAGRGWLPRPAPPGLIGAVRLDVSRLAGLIGAPAQADAAAIVADLRWAQGMGAEAVREAGNRR